MAEQAERRQMTREPVLMEGQITYGRWFERTIPCLVTETSSRGARIWTTAAARAPQRFRLHLGLDDEMGRKAYAVWSAGAERGVCFERAAAATRRAWQPLPAFFMRSRTA